MSAIVTGINGQDGYFMCKYLLDNTQLMIVGTLRYRTTASVNLRDYFPDEPRFSVMHLDITDNTNVFNVINKVKPQYFINMAAQSFVAKSWGIPYATWNTNALGVVNILESLHTLCPHCRFYNAGTSEEFGDVMYSPQTEDHPLCPQSPYGASKCAARHTVRVYRESYGMYAVQGWLFNHEGTRRGKDFVTRKITSTIASIKKTIDTGSIDFRHLELGNLDAKRDWSDAEDFMDGVWKMLHQECDTPKAYILSSGEMHSVGEFVEECLTVAGIEYEKTGDTYVHTKSGKLLVCVNPAFFRPAEVKVLLGDSKKARLELGWEPRGTFKTLVRKMFEHDYLQ